jgi:multicomponent Na+:H+ antiporter subunit C
VNKVNLTLVTVVSLLALGCYCLLTRDNMIKKVIGLNIMEGGLLLFLVAWGRVPGGTAPIFAAPGQVMVDPLPQALTLTAIVIGASTTAVMLAIITRLYKEHGTLKMSKIRRMRQ